MLCYCTAILLSIAGGVLSSDKPYYDLAEAEQHFANFIEKYDRHYENAEEYKRRFEIFKKKLSMINYWNRIHEATFDVNHFADEETPRTGHVRDRNMKLREHMIYKNWTTNTPASLDYRTMGLVTEVKDQKYCNSCYVFSAVGTIEGQYAKLTGELISLSEQQALDCVGKPCSEGGSEIVVIRSLSKTEGLMREADYPYEDVKGRCRTDKNKVKVKVISGDIYAIPNEEALKGALVELGPLSIGMEVTPSIEHYTKGEVYKPLDCHGGIPNHALVVVGYSTDKKGTPYWIIKNSWGKDWGNDGYLYLEMGKGHCSILREGAVSAKVARQ